MRVLLLGADGFIGRHIAFAFRQAGDDVLCVARNPQALENMGFATLRLDLASPEAATPEFWQRHIDEEMVIVHAAGLLTGSEAAMMLLHAHVPAALAEAGRQAKAARIILISAVGVEAGTLYGRSKRAGETALASSGLPFVILRPSLVLGETSYGGSSLLRALATLPFMTPVIGNGSQPFDPIHAADLAETVRFAATGTLDGQTISPCGPERVTQAEILQALRGWLGLRPAPIRRIPLSLARKLGRLGDALRLGPISRMSVAQLEQGVSADYGAYSATGSPDPRGFSKILTRPAGTQDLWQARLYLIRPLIRLTLALMWVFSGLLGLFLPRDRFVNDVALLGDTLAVLMARTFGLVDLAIAAALIAAWRLRLMASLQFATITGYTIGLTLLAPHLWADPYGGLLKNLPILALLAVHAILEAER